MALELVDSQLHAYSPAQVEAEGHGTTADGLLAMMDAVGVRAAVLVHPSKFGLDPTYSLEAAAAHPDRFGVIGYTDPDAPDLDDRLRGWRDRPGLLAARLVILTDEHRQRFEDGRYERLFAAAERHDVVLSVFAPRLLPLVERTAEAHPGLQIVVDHLGIAQPPLMQPDPEPFASLPSLLALARFANVAVKCSGAPTLARSPYPFEDLWPHLTRVFDAFGMERVMWGTDITRVHGTHPYPGRHTYLEAVSFLRDSDRLTPDEKVLVMGANLRRILRWPASERPDAS